MAKKNTKANAKGKKTLKKVSELDESKAIGEDKDFFRTTITLRKIDMENYEKLRKNQSLPVKSLSGMIRYLLDAAVNNPNMFKAVSNPDSVSYAEDFARIRDMYSKEQKDQEERLKRMEDMLKQLIQKDQPKDLDLGGNDF